MRKVKDQDALKAWLKSKTPGRAKILDYVNQHRRKKAKHKAKTVRVRVAARRSR
jgi:hypothetical protein